MKLFYIAISGLMAFAAAGQAATLNYSLTYTGTGTFTAAETASGSGTFQITTSGLTGTVTAFSFTDTLTSGGSSSTFNYGLANLLNLNSLVIGGTAANPTLATLTLTTGYVAGTNSTFGNVNFTGNYAAVNPGSGSTSSSPTVLLGITNGSITVSPVAASVPEPSTFGLLSVACIGGICGLLRRRGVSL